MRALYTAASGMAAQQMNVDVISNNLANVNTTAFKKARVEFKDLLYQQIQSGAASTQNNKPVNIEIGNGTTPVATLKSFVAGNVEPTENPLDLFIDGPGFFAVQGSNGQINYTRDGSFKLGTTADGNMQLVTTDGDPVLDSSDNPITFTSADPSKITFKEDGTISYNDINGNIVTADAPIQIVQFPNPEGLEDKGFNLYSATAASGSPTKESDMTTQEGSNSGKSIVRQGYLEASNVEVVDEMVKLIVAQRAYEMNSKSVQAADQMLQEANNIIRA